MIPFIKKISLKNRFLQKVVTFCGNDQPTTKSTEKKSYPYVEFKECKLLL